MLKSQEGRKFKLFIILILFLIVGLLDRAGTQSNPKISGQLYQQQPSKFETPAFILLGEVV